MNESKTSSKIHIYTLEKVNNGSDHKLLKKIETKKVSFFDQNMKNKMNLKVDYSDIDEQKGLSSPKFLMRKRKLDNSSEKSEGKQTNGFLNTNKESGDYLITAINLSSESPNNTSSTDEREMNPSTYFYNS